MHIVEEERNRDGRWSQSYIRYSDFYILQFSF